MLRTQNSDPIFSSLRPSISPHTPPTCIIDAIDTKIKMLLIPVIYEQACSLNKYALPWHHPIMLLILCGSYLCVGALSDQNLLVFLHLGITLGGLKIKPRSVMYKTNVLLTVLWLQPFLLHASCMFSIGHYVKWLP